MTPCMEHKGVVNIDGYGIVRIKGKNVRAHRLAYAKANNIALEALAGLVVRHRCDNPACVNADHLVIGTHADNMRDKVERNRSCTGSKNPNAKMNEFDIPFVRHWLKNGHPQAEIARCFGVDRGQIYKIAHGKGWKHV